MSFDVMNLDDPGWALLQGGYRAPYDPRKALRALEHGEDVKAAWEELWNELHHQGDVGEASYAAVPHLVRIHAARRFTDWNVYALIATIEDARQAPRNPGLPLFWADAYGAAWQGLVALGLETLAAADNPNMISSILAVVAIGKSQPALGRFACLFSEEERREFLVKAGWG